MEIAGDELDVFIVVGVHERGEWGESPLYAGLVNIVTAGHWLTYPSCHVDDHRRSQCNLASPPKILLTGFIQQYSPTHNKTQEKTILVLPALSGDHLPKMGDPNLNPLVITMRNPNSLNP
ncbi:MAG: hypothetical protein M1813_002075 [Trichoglossum hirsutum]|nr:MAG: hypothetical protein M1813_002075 [Trichoglossum hirsutum]